MSNFSARFLRSASSDQPFW